jgi:Flp pilus assembly protein CpaB
MKASTLFGITVAVLLGLGAVVGAKMMGLFQKQTAVEKPVETPQVLVAKQPLFEGITITEGQVTVRPLRPDEREMYEKNKAQYLPPVITAAVLRTPIRNIEADQPILKSYLEDLAIPDSIHQRLSPGMLAVNVAIPKERCAGGLILRGDRVDVLLTSRISDSGYPDEAITRSAYIARNLKVIVKRNQLWTVLAPNPDDLPVNYTLEANPYRSALIELAQTKGILSLMPTPASKSGKPGVSPTNIPTSVSPGALEGSEYEGEQARIEGVLRGDLTVGDSDLERIFKLKPLVRPQPPVYQVVRHITGNTPIGSTIFSLQGDRVDRFDARVSRGGADRPGRFNTRTPDGSHRPEVEGEKAFGYQFTFPDAPASSGRKSSYCPECEAAARRARGR